MTDAEEEREYNRWRVAEWRKDNPELARRVNREAQAKWRKTHRRQHLKRTRDRVRRLRAKRKKAA